MERLTRKCDSTGQFYILDKNTPYEELINIAIDKLAEYEEAEEQGLLIGYEELGVVLA